MSGDELTVAIASRPVRAAWLIEKAASSDNGIGALAGLAQACCRWWEGRNSILVRLQDGRLVEEAQRILRMHDPDEVIALANFSEHVIADVDRAIHPLVFSRATHVGSPISHADFRLQTLAALPSKTNLTRRAESLFSEEAPTLLLFAFSAKCPAAIQHCVSLNFGVYSHVIRQQDGQPDFGFASRRWRDLPHRVYVLGDIDDFANALDEIAGDFRKFVVAVSRQAVPELSLCNGASPLREPAQWLVNRADDHGSDNQAKNEREDSGGP